MVLNMLKANPKTFDWYRKGWMKLSVYDPYTKEISILKNDEFVPYHFVTDKIETITDFEQLVESTHKNLPVYTIN